MVFICVALKVVVLGAVASAFYLSQRSLHAFEGRRAELDQQLVEAAHRIELVHQLQEKQTRMAHQAELTASLLEKVPRSYLLAEITNAKPANVSFLDFTLESKVRSSPVNTNQNKTAYEIKKAEIEARLHPNTAAVGPAEPKAYDVTMKLTGLAGNDVQVAQFLKRLSRSKLFSDANLVISDDFVQNDQKLKKFQMEMTLNPEAEVRGGGKVDVAARAE